MGSHFLTAHIPDDIDVDIIDLPQTPAASDPSRLVRAALENLLGDVNWSDFAGVRFGRDCHQ